MPDVNTLFTFIRPHGTELDIAIANMRRTINMVESFIEKTRRELFSEPCPDCSHEKTPLHQCTRCRGKGFITKLTMT